MNTQPANTPNQSNDATPKKRSVVKTMLFILWLVVVIAWFYFIATWQ